MRHILLALPCLLGSQPPVCLPPSAADLVFDGTVVATEATTYSCSVGQGPMSDDPDYAGPGDCIIVSHGRQACRVMVRAADGTTREQDSPPGFGATFCDLPPGRHVVTTCTDNGGALQCPVDLAAGSGEIEVSARGSLPARFRHHVRADRPVLDGSRDLVLDSNDFGLTAGVRQRFTIRSDQLRRSRERNQPVLLSLCDKAAIPSRPPAGHGCAHCGAGGGETAYLAVIVLICLVGHRRRV
jgi:hypothetical protein